MILKKSVQLVALAEMILSPILSLSIASVPVKFDLLVHKLLFLWIANLYLLLCFRYAQWLHTKRRTRWCEACFSVRYRSIALYIYIYNLLTFWCKIVIGSDIKWKKKLVASLIISRYRFDEASFGGSYASHSCNITHSLTTWKKCQSLWKVLLFPFVVWCGTGIL